MAEAEQQQQVPTIVAVYNKYLVDMLLQQKPRAPALRHALREAGHCAIDPRSDDHIRSAAATLDAHAVATLDPEDALGDAAVLRFQPLGGVPMSDIVCVTEGEGGDEDAEKDASLRTYVYVLAVLAATHAAGSEVLTAAVLDALSSSQRGGKGKGKAVVLDDDIALLLDRVAECYRQSEPRSYNNPFEGLMKSMENSKIGDVAAEISKEINLSEADMQNPMDLLDFSKLTDSSSVLGSIVSKVGSKIQGKLASGELKQDELMSEALGFLKAFQGGAGAGGGMPGGGMIADLLKVASGGAGGGTAPAGSAGLMADLLKVAQQAGLGGGNAGSGGSGNHDAADRRERLRNKLNEKNKRQQQQ
jgi:hypothetical protein